MIQNINKQQTIDLCAALIALLLPFSVALPNVCLFLLIAFVAVNYKNFQWPITKAMLIYGMAILVLVVFALINGTFLDDVERYSKYFLVLLLFLLFAQVKSKRYIEYALLLGTFTALLISSIKIGMHVWETPGFLLDAGEMVNELLLLERPYFGCMLFLSVFICLKNAEKSSRRYDYYLLVFIFAAFSIYISARLSMGLICLLFFIYLFKNTQIQKKTKIWTALLLAFMFAIAMGLSDNLLSRMHVKEDLNKTFQLIKTYEPRFVIWPCAMSIAQNEMSVLTGLESYSAVENKLTQCYSQTIDYNKSKRQWYEKMKFNTHNQFLDFLLIGGIVPLLLLLLSFFMVWFGSGSFEFKLIFALFFAFFLIENVLHRQLGCYLFGIFVALYSAKKSHE